MKSPVRMIEDIAAQISEGRVLLQNIYRESEENEKTDCSIACLLRSLDKTIDNAYSYASQCSNTKKTQPTLTSEPAVGSTMTWPTEAGTKNQPTIGARIQHARENLDMSKDDLAEKLDVHPGNVLAWEYDDDQPLAGMIIPLANALKCDPMWLLSGNPLDVKAVSPATPAPVNVMKGADLANIGVRINNRRNQIMMSVDNLAKKIDTSGAMIREWETGKAIPHSDYIDKLAKALNTTVTWLMTGKHITA
ncbi:helix-turn-helix domain-containing protein [Salmonella enterica]|nr:helix-turn-helix domain-containing protein [Salmonella enterica]MDJ7049149.1 helix-turn-helix domain-containing protein [Salmonella enterica]MDJ7338330.1 helix-turn-helix domain-containing protein [Salmonella enterica]